MSFQVSIEEKKKGAYHLILTGSIDLPSSQEFEKVSQRLMNRRPEGVGVDMSGVDYISSTGIRILFDFTRKLAAAGGVCAMFGLRPSIRKVFDVVKAFPPESIFSTGKEADVYLESGPGPHTP